jgi:acyl-CoA synthetase (AMP-forming)/AMP-acid ligase II/acyl carrier protein
MNDLRHIKVHCGFDVSLDFRDDEIPIMQRQEDIPSLSLTRGQSLVDLLRQRAAAMGEKPVFSFLRGNGEQEASLTYQSLHERAMAIAAELQTLAPPGERALLLFPPGLEFISAFFGCLYAGIVAVPAAIPNRNRMTASIEAVFEASRPSLVLSTADHREQAKRTYASQGTRYSGSGLAERPWIAVDRIGPERGHAWHDLQVGGRQIAFLQYTSGSTSLPKGVMLSHDQLLHNASLIQDAFHTTTESRAVFWLPLYHDMGLIGGVIQPVYCGGSSTLMAPAAFLQRPALWLETISRTRSTVSGGPDFAYDLCMRKIPAEERAQLDLSCWELAFLGAERIRPQTVDHFASLFASCGFRREAFFPCYGLAEATLMVSGGPRQEPPVVLHVNADALARNQVEIGSAQDATCRTLVGCGENLRGQRIVIVDPRTHISVPDGHVGEIWVQGPSVAHGYYEDPQATAATFQARLAGAPGSPGRGEGPFLRTGDLGFILRKQLFVTGRLKNLIIIRGRNHYPEDIEQTINSAYKGLRVGYCAAFSIEVEDHDQLVVVQEVEPRHRGLDGDAAIQAIRTAIAIRHDLEVHAVVLVKAGTVPKTSSGKTRRAACRERYLRGELEILAAWNASGDEAEHELADAPAVVSPREVQAAEIESWLIERITARLRLAPGDVKVTTPFLELGMGSLDAVDIAAALERWLGRQLSPTAIYNYPTIAALARWLAVSPTVGTWCPGAVDAAAAAPFTHPPANLNSEQLLAEVRGMTEQDMERFLAQELAKQQGK